ncbi:YCF48-related protein [Pseudoduganella sp. LjRoot289]|uniref:WD40/YVTN/BNR-like repeat-containing protein n=1 Tax=Pseudoduganella sp. LjRoot289 TaxID=3342314 RepID=UPI003ECE8A25
MAAPPVSPPAPGAAFQPPQDQGAMPSRLAASSPILALARAGERIVAVGLRGHIVISDDGGRQWKQARSPVSSDLLAVSFPTSTQGWAVGHGGVVLHSADGGATWTRQLDGRQASALAIRHYEAQLAAGKQAGQFLKREQSLAVDGTQPFLDVYFESATTGYVVGTFNRLYRTQDGGKTWTPWMDRSDNPDELHFYAIRGGAHGVYLVGEQGMVWRLDAAAERFVAMRTPYKGTLFGVVSAGPGTLLVYGMRGSLLRTADEGKTWETIATGNPAGITSGAVLQDGTIVLVNQAGGIDLSRDDGKSFNAQKSARPMSYFGVAALGGKQIALAGSEGVRLEIVKQEKD